MMNQNFVNILRNNHENPFRIGILLYFIVFAVKTCQSSQGEPDLFHYLFAAFL